MNKLGAGLLVLLLCALAPFASADAPSLVGTTWQYEGDTTYSKVEFQPDRVTRYLADDAAAFFHKKSDELKQGGCKVFQYKDVSLADLEALRPRYFAKGLKADLAKQMAEGKTYPALVTSDDCGEIYIVLSRQKGIYIQDVEAGYAKEAISRP